MGTRRGGGGRDGDHKGGGEGGREVIMKGGWVGAGIR